MPKTVSKGHTKKVTAIFDAADPSSGKCMSLANNFTGESVPLDVLRRELATGHNTKLTDNENGTYTIHVHGNLWFTFARKEET